MMKEFDINCYVGVKLTNEGEKIFKKYCTNCGLKRDDIDKLFPLVDGYYRIQMWQLMTIFSKYLYNGNVNPPMYNQLLIDDNDLAEYKQKKLVKSNRKK